MATATRAAIEITAADKTGAAFASLRSNMSGVQGGIDTLAARFAGIQATIAAALGGLGIGALVTGVSQSLEAFNDLSDATGASVESISRLDSAVRRTGGSFDDASALLVKFNQALGQADAGSQQAKVFEALGLSVEKLRRADPVQALIETAQAFQKFEKSGELGRAQIDILGKSVSRLAPVLKDLAESSVEFGAVTAEQASNAEEFNKALARVRAGVTDLARSTLVDLLPAMTVALDAFDKTSDSAEDLFKWSDLLRVPFEALVILGANVAFTFKGVGRELGAIGAQLAALARGDFAGFRSISDAVKEDAARARAELDSFERRLLNAGKTPGAAGDSQGPKLPGFKAPGRGGDAKKAARDFEDYAQSITKSVANMFADTDVARLQRVNAQLAELDTRWAGTNPAQLAEVRKKLLDERAKLTEITFSADEMFPPPSAATIAAYESMQKVLENTPTAKLEEQRGLMLALADAYERGRFGIVGSTDAIQRWGEAVDTALGRVPQELDKITTFAEEAARNIQDALGDTLTKLLDGDFKSIGSLWSNLLKKMAVEALAANLNQYLFGKGPTTGEGVLGPIFQAIFGLPKRAAGGPVSAGTPYLVGERGPELIVPRGAGTVIPNHALGGSTVVQNFNVAAGVQRNELMTALQITAQAIKGEVYGTLRMKGVL